jgi:hypothetical protein
MRGTNPWVRSVQQSWLARADFPGADNYTGLQMSGMKLPAKTKGLRLKIFFSFSPVMAVAAPQIPSTEPRFNRVHSSSV